MSCIHIHRIPATNLGSKVSGKHLVLPLSKIVKILPFQCREPMIHEKNQMIHGYPGSSLHQEIDLGMCDWICFAIYNRNTNVLLCMFQQFTVETPWFFDAKPAGFLASSFPSCAFRLMMPDMSSSTCLYRWLR